MKNRRENTLIGFFVIVIFMFIFIACDDNDVNDPLIYVDNLVETSIKIYKHSSVSTEQVNVAITTLEYIYSAWNVARRTTFEANITEIHIGSINKNISHNGTILHIYWNDSVENIATYLMQESGLTQGSL